MARYVVARVDEIGPGDRKLTVVGGRSIGVFNIGGEFYALRNRCPHQGGPLCAGPTYGALESPAPGEYQYSRDGEMLRCPWHGWEFDITTGQSWFDPATTRVRSYEAQVASGRELQAQPGAAEHAALEKGPYVAETYSIDVEGDYVVVDLSAPAPSRRGDALHANR